VAPLVGARILAVAILISALVAGCAGLLPAGIAPGARACVGLPQTTCEQQFQDADARARERGTTVVGIVIRCSGVCTEASGEGQRNVTYGDGTSEQSGFGWQSAGPAPVGPPIRPEPSLSVAPTCVGVDAVTCETQALSSVSTLEQDAGEVVAITVRCRPGPCTPTTGDGETLITFADGQSTTVSWTYRGGP